MARTCGHIWWTKHEIPGQPCVRDCPRERQICVLRKNHDEDHQSKTGRTTPLKAHRKKDDGV